MSYAQALEQQLAMMRAMHSPAMSRYAVDEMGCEESGRKYLEAIHGVLELADPYYWSTEICGVINGVQADMPDWTLRAESLQGEAGFFWFARPFGVPCPSSEHVISSGPHYDDLAGIVWAASRQFLARGGDSDEPVVFVTPVIRDPDGNMFTGRHIPWCFGWTREFTSAQWEDRPTLRAHNDAILRVFSACLAFIEQRILVARQELAPRATRKRAAERIAHEPLIRVVELRRRQTVNTGEREGEPREVDWSCRWVVSGHWRQQFYPSDGSHRPVFVLPYLKGPDSKPLKPPRAKVFAVVR